MLFIPTKSIHQLRNLSKLPLILFLLLPTKTVLAQALEVGAGVGLANYKGDLNPNFNPLVARPGGNILVRYNFSRAFSVKATSTYSYITGNDKLSSNPLNKERGWKFYGRIQDWGVDLEYNFLNFRSYGTIVKSRWTPILFAGLSQFRMPSRVFEAANQKYRADIKYPNFALSYGFGFKREINASWNLSGSFACRLPIDKSNYDYLDGIGYFNDPTEPFKDAYPNYLAESPKVSTPNTHTRDRYFYSTITLSYIFQGIKCPNPRR